MNSCALILTAILLGQTTNSAPQSDEGGAIPWDQRENALEASEAFRDGRYDEAATDYLKIIQTHPHSLYGWSNLGIVRFQQGKLPEARDALEHAVALNPKDAVLLSNLGVVHYQLGSYQDALKYLRQAVALTPNDAGNHNFLGDAYEKAGMAKEAKLEHQKAIDLIKAQNGGKFPAPKRQSN